MVLRVCHACQGEPRYGVALALRLVVPLLALEVTDAASAAADDDDMAPERGLFRLCLFDAGATAALEGGETSIRWTAMLQYNTLHG